MIVGNPARILRFEGLNMGFANFRDNCDVRLETQEILNFILSLETSFTVPKNNAHLCNDKLSDISIKNENTDVLIIRDWWKVKGGRGQVALRRSEPRGSGGAFSFAKASENALEG